MKYCQQWLGAPKPRNQKYQDLRIAFTKAGFILILVIP